MKLATRTQNDIKREFLSKFGSKYSFGTATAPQGQNRYSSNFLLSDGHNNRFLLKVLLLQKIPSSNRSQVENEINICKRVSSPYVARLEDCVLTNKYVFLIFPFLDGKNLEGYAREHGVLSEEKVKEIGIGILRGIVDINRSSNGNVIHQDIKPENVLITNNGEVVLLDFGAARYKQSPFRGSARHNYAYSSREQIRASRPNTLEELRITLSDKADVFGVGLILYRLLQGKHPHHGLEDKLPADATLEARSIPPITNTGVSNGLKKIIGRMLEYEPLNRFSALEAISALESGDTQPISLGKGKLYYCAASSVGRFVKFKSKDASLFDGLVVEASQVPANSRTVAELHTNLKTLLVDPQTYLFQKPELITDKFKKVPFYSSNNLFRDSGDLVSKVRNGDHVVKEFIKKVFRFQIESGADALIPPYFYIQEFNDNYWTVDQEITKLSEEIYFELSTSKPLIKGVSISEEVLQSDDSRNRIIEYLQSLYEYTGFFVLVDSSHRDTITNENWLKCARDFFTYLLATQKFVIWSRAELFGLALAASGFSIATGEFSKQRKFNICEPLQTFGRRGKFFYSPIIFARIKWPEGLQALKNYERVGDLACPQNCCSHIDFDTLAGRDEEDLAFHWISSIRCQFDIYIGRDGMRKLAESLKEAKVYYGEIQRHSNILVRKALQNDIKPGSSGFLESWANALGIQ